MVRLHNHKIFFIFIHILIFHVISEIPFTGILHDVVQLASLGEPTLFTLDNEGMTEHLKRAKLSLQLVLRVLIHHAIAKLCYLHNVVKPICSRAYHV